MKEIIVKINVEEEDFCELDLREVLEEGFSNVGNHTLGSFVIIPKEHFNHITNKLCKN